MALDIPLYEVLLAHCEGELTRRPDEDLRRRPPDQNELVRLEYWFVIIFSVLGIILLLSESMHFLPDPKTPVFPQLMRFIPGASFLSIAGVLYLVMVLRFLGSRFPTSSGMAYGAVVLAVVLLIWGGFTEGRTQDHLYNIVEILLSFAFGVGFTRLDTRKERRVPSDSMVSDHALGEGTKLEISRSQIRREEKRTRTDEGLQGGKE